MNDTPILTLAEMIGDDVPEHSRELVDGAFRQLKKVDHAQK